MVISINILHMLYFLELNEQILNTYIVYEACGKHSTRTEAAKMYRNKFLGTSNLEDVKKASVQKSTDVC